MEQTVIKLAIQKSGRLSEKSIELLKNCGIKFVSNSSSLKTKAFNFPMEILFLRDDDIPRYVADGVADFGILGMNEIVEQNQNVEVIKKLGFSKCRLSIAVPNDFKYDSIQSLEGKKIATSYPVLLEKHLNSVGVKAEIHEISGSVEIAPTIGLADAICDLVSTGGTLLMNGLKEVEEIYKSEAALIGNVNLSSEKKALLAKWMLRIEAVEKAQNNKYILMNVPNSAIEEVCNLLPGMKSPTIIPLKTEGWSSVHSVIHEDTFWEIIEKVKAAGAEGILVCPIEQMVL
ncbi:MAG TPA: ATP phosphoribosyltransferase [Bacteroidales bacterium]|nr:ATP phosphoribosyltransferase [Bacteroidales bacterium]